jgi:hypothetical protein
LRNVKEARHIGQQQKLTARFEPPTMGIFAAISSQQCTPSKNNRALHCLQPTYSWITRKRAVAHGSVNGILLQSIRNSPYHRLRRVCDRAPAGVVLGAGVRPERAANQFTIAMDV